MGQPFNNRILIALLLILSNTILYKAQYITVDTNYNAQQLIDKFVGNQSASCLKITNPSITGWNFGGNDLSYGYFTKGTSRFDIDEGIILSTGKALQAPGPKSSTVQSNYDSRWLGDTDLIDALQAQNLDTDHILNATVLEFDFESNLSQSISFDYMFFVRRIQKY